MNEKVKWSGLKTTDTSFWCLVEFLSAKKWWKLFNTLHNISRFLNSSQILVFRVQFLKLANQVIRKSISLWHSLIRDTRWKPRISLPSTVRGKMTRSMQNFKGSPSLHPPPPLRGCFLHPTTTSVGFCVNIIVLLSWSWLTSLHSSLRSPGLKPRVGLCLSTVNNGNYLHKL